MNFLKGFYKVEVECQNCRKDVIISIRRGTTIKESIDNGRLRCPNCSCNAIPNKFKTNKKEKVIRSIEEVDPVSLEFKDVMEDLNGKAEEEKERRNAIKIESRKEREFDLKPIKQL